MKVRRIEKRAAIIGKKKLNRRQKTALSNLKTLSRKGRAGLIGPPTADDLNFTKKGNKDDSIIRGWTKYWNEIFQARDKLDPNLVKSLIATESGFDPQADTKKKGPGRARGLMQITDTTRKVLQDEKGEIKEKSMGTSLFGSQTAYPSCLSVSTFGLPRRRLLLSKFIEQV